jgi:hypothetical protein
MPTCANCNADAFYDYAITNDFSIKYCAYHLPRSLVNKVTIIETTPIEDTSVSKKSTKTTTNDTNP